MKQLSVLIAALLPVTAFAGGDDRMQGATWEAGETENAWQATEIIGSELQGSDGSDLGQVEDIVLTRDGKPKAVLFKSDSDSTDRVFGEFLEQRRQQDPRVVAHNEMMKIDWMEPSFEPNVMQVDVTEDTLQERVAFHEYEQPVTEGNVVQASELIGMDINLRDQEDYAEVRDVLIHPDEDKAALVVHIGGDDEYRAIPMDRASNVDTDTGEIDYKADRREVEAVVIVLTDPRFEREQ